MPDYSLLSRLFLDDEFCYTYYSDDDTFFIRFRPLRKTNGWLSATLKRGENGMWERPAVFESGVPVEGSPIFVMKLIQEVVSAHEVEQKKINP